MDGNLTEERLIAEIKNELNQNFPQNIVEENKEQIDKQIQKVVSFIIKLSENKYFAYMRSRQDNISIEKHISVMPCGISKFEEWLNDGLLDFAKEIFSSLNIEMSSNMDFARLVDNRDYDAFIINSKTKDTDIEQWKLLLEPIFQMSETPYLTQAFACINLSLDNAALSLLQQWIQSLWFKDKSLKNVFDDARKIEAIRNEHAKAGKKGAAARRSVSNEVKAYAIKLFQEGSFKNPNQAADFVANDVIKYGKSIGFEFTTSFQATKTIYKWLTKSNKQKSKSY